MQRLAWILVVCGVLACDPMTGPTVAPASGGRGVPLIVGTFSDVDALDYQTTEFFVSGDAESYSPLEPLTPDGRWKTAADPTTAPYKTRVIVHQPKDPQRFNGTVYVEWLNVSGGVDASPDWVYTHLEVARQGAAYVLVSAQFVGVDQLVHGGVSPGDPERYGSLVHPGDSYSYDIFSQAGEAVWQGHVLGGRAAQRVFALGESQSAFRMVTYINGVHPLADVYDGFILHSRGADGAPLREDPLPTVESPQTAIRDDLVAGVIVVQSEGDVAATSLLVRQPETPEGNFRLWEVAGGSHFDVYGLQIGPQDTGGAAGAIANLEVMQNPPSAPVPGIIECALPINAGPMHFVMNAAIHRLHLWVAEATPPPTAPRLEAVTAPGVMPVEFALGGFGNALGGIRTPYVDVPIGNLSGSGNTRAPNAPGTSGFCFLFGRTVPFTDAELRALYPSHEGFVQLYLFSTLEAFQSGFVLWPDALRMLRAAVVSDVGR